MPVRELEKVFVLNVNYEELAIQYALNGKNVILLSLIHICTYSKLYMGRNKHGLKKLINKPYYVLTPFPQNTSTVFNSSYSRRNVTIKKPWRLLRSRRFRESFNYVI